MSVLRGRCLGATALVVSLSMVSASAAAQAIAGRVVALPSRAPAAGVKAALVDTGSKMVTTTVTDGEGIFTLEAPAPGVYRVVLVATGGLTYLAPPLTVAAGDYLEREFQLPHQPSAEPELYFATQVDAPAQIVRARRGPRYPQWQRDEGIRGFVTALFIVDTTGTVELPSLQIVSESDAAFGRAVRENASAWRFQPARRAGRPVRQVVQLTFDFGIGNDPHRGDVVIRATGIVRTRQP